MSISQISTRPLCCPVLYFIVVLSLLPATVFAEKMAVDTPTVKQILKGDDTQITEEVQPRETVPYDRLNRSTPRSSVVSLIEAIKNTEHEILLESLDMRYVPKKYCGAGSGLGSQVKDSCETGVLDRA
ncbi:hypothetical protein BMR04_04700 [Methylococcaceae bacterium HT3]|nr:hypothetical protein BMR04_04700 [Methylococcaceae bacterium HT3]